MLTQVLRTSPGVISGLALLIGFALVASRSWPLAIAGSALILLAFFVPFIRLGVVASETKNASDPGATPRDPNATQRPDDPAIPRRPTNGGVQSRQHGQGQRKGQDLRQ